MLFTLQVLHSQYFFLLTIFDACGCYYFKLNFNLLMYINVLLKKNHVILFCSLLNMKKQLSLMCLIVLFFYFIGEIFGKMLSKLGGWEKRYKGVGIATCAVGLSIKYIC